ncbi:Mitochondrial import inner membrane translocase subunit tim22 [Irineochytrium annulatum]|nr:Mitochondrial import inner membrane translocase subunit tim22 [Irineochytrium annulatum]
MMLQLFTFLFVSYLAVDARHVPGGHMRKVQGKKVEEKTTFTDTCNGGFSKYLHYEIQFHDGQYYWTCNDDGTITLNPYKGDPEFTRDFSQVFVSDYDHIIPGTAQKGRLFQCVSTGGCLNDGSRDGSGVFHQGACDTDALIVMMCINNNMNTLIGGIDANGDTICSAPPQQVGGEIVSVGRSLPAKMEGQEGASPPAPSQEPRGFWDGFNEGAAMPISPMTISDAFESCPVKAVTALGAGFVLGGLFGMFMSSVDGGFTNDEFLKLSTREQIRLTLKDMGAKCYSSAKNFAVVGGVYASTECVIESFRAKNDMYNGISAGCITGAALAARELN